jgi:hypothetical protein
MSSSALTSEIPNREQRVFSGSDQTKQNPCIYPCYRESIAESSSIETTSTAIPLTRFQSFARASIQQLPQLNGGPGDPGPLLSSLCSSQNGSLTEKPYRHGVIISSVSASRGDVRNSNVRNTRMDALRILFALLVLLSHSQEIPTGDRETEYLSILTHRYITFGDLGVDGFFLLSGFLILKSWQHDPEPINYLKSVFCVSFPDVLWRRLSAHLSSGFSSPAKATFSRS